MCACERMRRVQMFLYMLSICFLPKNSVPSGEIISATKNNSQTLGIVLLWATEVNLSS